MKLIKFRSPCNRCVIQPMCKEPCDDYSKFIAPIYERTLLVTSFFEWVDDRLEDYEYLSRAYDFIGEYILSPAWCLMLRFVFGLKTTINDKFKTMDDIRYRNWQSMNRDER